MAILNSKQVASKTPYISVTKTGDVAAPRQVYALSAALALNDIIVMGSLPQGCLPVDLILDSDDLDTGGSPAITLSVGILNAGQTDIDTTASGGAAWIAASTVAQAGGLVRPTTAAITRTPVSTSEQFWGIKVAAAPATGAATGTIGATLMYRAAVKGL